MKWRRLTPVSGTYESDKVQVFNSMIGESGDESLLENGGHSIQSLKTLKSIASLPQEAKKHHEELLRRIQQFEEQRQQQLMARIRALEEELAAEKQSKASAPLLSSSPVSEPPVRQIVEIHLKRDEQTAQVQVAQPKLEKGETSKTVRKLSLEEEVDRMETALLCKDVADRAKIIQEETLVALLETKKHNEELLGRVQQFPIVQAELPTASKTVRKPSIEEEVVDRMETALCCKDVSVADQAKIMQLIQEESLEAEQVAKEQKVLRRIQQEWEAIQRDVWPENFSGNPSETDLYLWEIILVGPAGTPYEDKVYTLSCTFPTDYPDSPPNVCFTTPIQHPNVDRDGNVGLEILQSKWTSDNTVVRVLQSIYEFIVEPDLDNAVNQDLAEEYYSDEDSIKSTYCCELINCPGEYQASLPIAAIRSVGKGGAIIQRQPCGHKTNENSIPTLGNPLSQAVLETVKTGALKLATSSDGGKDGNGRPNKNDAEKKEATIDQTEVKVILTTLAYLKTNPNASVTYMTILFSQLKRFPQTKPETLRLYIQRGYDLHRALTENLTAQPQQSQYPASQLPKGTEIPKRTENPTTQNDLTNTPQCVNCQATFKFDSVSIVCCHNCCNKKNK